MLAQPAEDPQMKLKLKTKSKHAYGCRVHSSRGVFARKPHINWGKFRRFGAGWHDIAIASMQISK